MDWLILFKDLAQLLKAESIICYHHLHCSALQFGKKRSWKKSPARPISGLILVVVYHLLCYASVTVEQCCKLDHWDDLKEPRLPLQVKQTWTSTALNFPQACSPAAQLPVSTRSQPVQLSPARHSHSWGSISSPAMPVLHIVEPL